MRVLLIHSGSAFSTHDVYTGLLGGLKMAGVEVVPYRLDYHLTAATDWIEWVQQREGTAKPGEDIDLGDVYYQAVKGATVRALEVAPDAIIIVAGLRIDMRGYIILQRLGVPIVLFGTENPYDDDYYYPRAPLCDVVTCNDAVSVPGIETACREAGTSTRVVHMPLGYLPQIHHPGVADEVSRKMPVPSPSPNVEFGAVEIPAHDVVFVGTGFPERIAFLEAIDWTGIDLGLYGSWRHAREDEARRPVVGPDSPIYPFIRGELVSNAFTAALYDRAKIVLNLFRVSAWREGGIEERGGGTAISPRLIEAAAIGACVATEWRPEVEPFAGNTMRTFTAPAECEAAIRGLLADDGERAIMRAAVIDRAEGYGYDVRARELVALIEDAIRRRALDTGHRAA